jgi:hypothetical protein
MVSINIQKKDLWLLSAIVVFFVGIGFVIAYGSGSPTTMGHDAGELDGVQARIATGLTACSVGNSIRTINPDTGVVTCEPDTDTDTVSGLVTGWVVTTSMACAGGWGTGMCGGGTPFCAAGNTLRQTGIRDLSGGGYYLCIRD